jgi:hypothetical protein
VPQAGQCAIKPFSPIERTRAFAPQLHVKENSVGCLLEVRFFVDFSFVIFSILAQVPQFHRSKLFNKYF